MKVGTIENSDFEEEERVGKKGVGRSGSGSTGPGGPNDDGGDNGDDYKPDNFKETPKSRERAIPPNSGSKSKIFTWFLLLVVLMTFGGLIGAYVVLATNNALEWEPFDLPIQVWISTALIIGASITFELGKLKYSGRKFPNARNYLLITTIIGAAFISSQLLAWWMLVQQGYYMSGNPYAGFFYILTATHAVHVIGGVCALGYILLSSWQPPVSELDFSKKLSDFTATSWYWHAMGVLWLVIILLLGFWK